MPRKKNTTYWNTFNTTAHTAVEDAAVALGLDYVEFAQRLQDGRLAQLVTSADNLLLNFDKDPAMTAILARQLGAVVKQILRG